MLALSLSLTHTHANESFDMIEWFFLSAFEFRNFANGNNRRKHMAQGKLLLKCSEFIIIMKAKQSIDNVIQELSKRIRKKVTFIVLLHEKTNKKQD